MKDAQPKIAIIGSGIAGLACGFMLSKHFAVTIFESQDTLGMDSASVSVGKARMDVPLRTFSTDYYPNLSNLYEQLGLNFSSANYQFTLSTKETQSRYFAYYNFYRNRLFRKIFGYELVSIPILISFHPVKFARYAWMLFELYKFQKRGPKDLASGKCENKTFKMYVLESYSASFYYELLLPMLSVICTCTWDAVGEYPAEIIVDYMAGRSRERPMGSTTMRVTDGTIEIVNRLSRPCDRVKTGTFVSRIITAPQRPAQVVYKVKNTTEEEHTETFDHVIIATQANAATKLLESGKAKEILSKVKYEQNRTVLHSDESSLPPFGNSTCLLQVDVKRKESDCTIWMNRIDPLLHSELQDQKVFQTWNPLSSHEGAILDVIFERPVMTLDSFDNLTHLESVQGHGQVWFVGAYSLYSMPLLENGVRSAIRVANKLLQQVGGEPVKELGTQLSGAAFAKRRPDLSLSGHDANRKSKWSVSALALDGIVLSVILGSLALCGHLVTRGRRFLL